MIRQMGDQRDTKSLFGDEPQSRDRGSGGSLETCGGDLEQDAPDDRQQPSTRLRPALSATHVRTRTEGMAKHVENAHPWEASGPCLLRTIPLDDIDCAHKRFQLRFPRDPAQLRKSLRSVGQRNPIKVMPGENGYLVIDGHSRVEQAKRLGWESVRVLLFPMMSDSEAIQLAWQSNVVRRNLSCVERANAIVMGLRRGLTLDEVANALDITRRTAQRYIEIPERLLRYVDGKIVTMAHAKVLLDVVSRLSAASLEEWINRIRSQRWSKAQLLKQMRLAGLGPGRRREARCFCKVTDSDVRLYERRLTRQAKSEVLLRARAQLSAALEALNEMLRPSTTPSRR